jgi:catechol 2,3-dioxygenase-like lactoylglutathione lyase family enzyme
MIGHVTIGAADFDLSLAFYDWLLGSIGAEFSMPVTSVTSTEKS